MAKILIVDNSTNSRTAEKILRKGGYESETALNMKTGVRAAAELPPGSLLLVSYHLSDGNAVEFIELLRSRRINHPVIVFGDTLHSSEVHSALRMNRAVDYIQSLTFDKTLIPVVNACLPATGKGLLDKSFLLPRTSPAWESLMISIKMLAPTDNNLLIVGEAGLGKSTVAHVIHGRSQRGNRPLAVLSHARFETESCTRDRCPATFIRECFDKANGGSVLIENIDCFCSRGQSIILAMMEEPTYNVRVMATAENSIHEQSVNGLFNRALFDALTEGALCLPPLRENPQDIECVANHLLYMIQRKIGQRHIRIGARAMNLLKESPWPGNVAQLKSVLLHCSSVSMTGEITYDTLSEILNPAPPAPREMTEEEMIVDALRKSNSLRHAAAMLNMSERTLRDKRDLYNLDRKGNKIAA